MDGEVIAILMVFGIPMTALVTYHMRKMAEIKARIGTSVDANVLGAIRELKEQFNELRDTTTKYDMSFDAALQRIENRVNHLEGRVGRVEQQSPNPAQISQSSGL